jgi:chemotaxis protein histidine kinase CheA
VIVVVTDDGAGFDVEALRREAVERGHAGDGDVDLAFIAGLSTRQIRDDLAGHGVGMGAVRDELAQVGYVVRISSRAGHGARIVIEPARPLTARSVAEAPRLTEAP